jgi:TRAP-type transport system periplasmic protein
VTNPGDFKGVKARTQSFPIAIATTKAMGATPISMAFGEVYTGLSQGTIDAAESPLSGIYNAKWQEAVKHLALTAHFVQIAPLSMSQKVYDSLKPEYQTLLEDTFLKYSRESNVAIEQSEAEWIEKFKEDGIEVNEVDKDSFREACQSVYRSVDNWTPGLYDKIKQILGY